MPSIRSAALASAAIAAAASPLAARASTLPQQMDLVARQQQDPSTPLYLNSPFCNYFQCAIIWGAGDQAVVNWLNAPAGDVQVDLMTDASSRVAYPIAKAPSVSSSCDAGAGYGVAVPGTTCGGFVFTVPSDWQNGNYSMRAVSVQTPGLESYTDVILIMNNGTVPNTPFAVVSGSIEGGASSTAAAPSASATSSAPTSSATAAPSSSGSARPTSSAPRPSSTAPAPTGGAQNSGVRASSSIVLGSAAALALGLAALI